MTILNFFKNAVKLVFYLQDETRLVILHASLE
jgi:hypothetical protein